MRCSTIKLRYCLWIMLDFNLPKNFQSQTWSILYMFPALSLLLPLRIHGSRSAGQPPLCTWEGVCGALAPTLGAGLGRVGRPSAAREPREEKEEGLAEKEPALALAAPPTFPTAPALRRKGEDEEEEEKERGWAGRTGYKDRLGGWWQISGLPSSVFS